ncbi:MAG: nucleotidyltransferase domain-containing protein [Kofleriaceae bacterium]
MIELRDGPGLDLLTPHQLAVATPYLDARAGERDHLVIYLSGAHAYGFPSPDSDLDLKCVHIAPTERLVGLEVSVGGAERLEIVDGVELDYGSNELGDVLRGVVAGNGNYLERLLGRQVVRAAAGLLDDLRPLVRATLSRRVVRHYRGFATAQLRAAEERPTAKRVLYVLRTARTGLHLLTAGEVETDLTRLAPSYGPTVDELIVRKQTGERAALSAEEFAGWRALLGQAVDQLGEAVAGSPLPPEPPAEAVAALDAWLCEVRRARFAATPAVR